VGVTNTLATLEFGHRDGRIDFLVVDLWCVSHMLVNSLGSVVVLCLLSASFDYGLDLFNDVLVHVLVNLGSIHGSRVSLITDVGVVLSLSLRPVLCRRLIADILSSLPADLWSYVLVMSLFSLAVEDWLDLLVDLGLIALSVYDRGDLVVCVSLNVLMHSCVLDVASMGSTDLVIDGSLSRSSIGQCGDTIVSGRLVEGVVVLLSGVVGRERAHDSASRRASKRAKRVSE